MNVALDYLLILFLFRLLKIKIRWVNFKDLIDFIQQIMNQAAFNVGDRKELLAGTKSRDFMVRKEGVMLGK